MWRRVVILMLVASVLAAIMQAIRLLLIEPDAMAEVCAVNTQQWQCQLRMFAIQGFVRHWYGPASLLAVVLSWLSGVRSIAWLAVLAGMAGVVLYDFEVAAFGLMLGSLLLVREHALRSPMIHRQTQAK